MKYALALLVACGHPAAGPAPGNPRPIKPTDVATLPAGHGVKVLVKHPLRFGGQGLVDVEIRFTPEGCEALACQVVQQIAFTTEQFQAGFAFPARDLVDGAHFQVDVDGPASSWCNRTKGTFLGTVAGGVAELQLGEDPEHGPYGTMSTTELGC